MMPKKAKPVTALLVIFFILGFPLVGLLLTWNDVQFKIRHRAEEFVQESFPDFLVSLQNGKPNDDSSIAFNESFNKADFENLHGKPTLGEVKAVDSWAVEENDQGAQYAEVHAVVTWGTDPKPVNYTIKIRRLTIGPRWRYLEVKPQ